MLLPCAVRVDVPVPRGVQVGRKGVRPVCSCGCCNLIGVHEVSENSAYLEGLREGYNDPAVSPVGEVPCANVFGPSYKPDTLP